MYVSPKVTPKQSFRKGSVVDFVLRFFCQRIFSLGYLDPVRSFTQSGPWDDVFVVSLSWSVERSDSTTRVYRLVIVVCNDVQEIYTTNYEISS